MTFEEFSQNCLRRNCLRRTFYTGNCVKRSKQIKCYDKYNHLIEKRNLKRKEYFENLNSKECPVDQRWVEVRNQILERDKVCRLWKVLTANEKEHILKNFSHDFFYLKDILDVAHIKPRSTHPELYYDPENLLLLSRYFHSLLDSYIHPVTRTSITSEERDVWFQRIVSGGV